MFGLNLFQVLVILVVVAYYSWDLHGPQMMIMTNTMAAVIIGTVLGDTATGLYIGATLSLMSLGVVGLGGASVPDFFLSTVIAVIVAIQTGQGYEVGLTVGLPVGMMFIYLDVLCKITCGFFARQQEACIDSGDYAKIDFWAWAGEIASICKHVLPVLIILLFGQGAVQALVDIMPGWLYNGLSLAGKLLPVTGLAILLNYMPVKRHLSYLLIGFVLYSYLGVGTIGVGIVGAALAYKYWLDAQKTGTAVANGGLEDE